MERFDILLNSFEDVCIENTIQDALYTADVALEHSLIQGAASKDELIVVAEGVLKEGYGKAKTQLMNFYNFLKGQIEKLIDWIKVWMTRGGKLFTKYESRIKKAYSEKKGFKYKGTDFSGFDSAREEIVNKFTNISKSGKVSKEESESLNEQIDSVKEKYKEKDEVSLPSIEEVKKVLTGKSKDIESLNKTKKSLKEAFDKAIKSLDGDVKNLKKDNKDNKNDDDIESASGDVKTAKELKSSASKTIGFLTKYTKARASQYERAVKKLLTGKADSDVSDKDDDSTGSDEEATKESLFINDGEYVIETAFGYESLEDVLENVSYTLDNDYGMCNENVTESILAGFRDMIK